MAGGWEIEGIAGKTGSLSLKALQTIPWLAHTHTHTHSQKDSHGNKAIKALCVGGSAVEKMARTGGIQSYQDAAFAPL